MGTGLSSIFFRGFKMEQVVSTKTIYISHSCYFIHGIGIDVNNWLKTVYLDYYLSKIKNPGESLLVKAILPTGELGLVVMYWLPPIDLRFLIPSK